MTEETEGVRKDSATREKDQKENIDWRNKNFYQIVYADLYEENEAGTELILTDADTFYKWVSSTAGETSGKNFAVASTANDTITIGASGGGLYLVVMGACFGGSNNSLIHGALHLNGSPLTGVKFHRKLAGSDYGSAGANALIRLSSGDVLDLRFSSDTDTTTLTFMHVHFTVTRISP